MNDIVSVVQSYGIELRKIGKVYQGLCPFHKDTEPSFTVYPETNTFYCFGCGISGDLTRFIKLIDPTFHDQFKLDLSSLQHFVEHTSSRNYRSYLLVSSSKIFHEMFSTRPVGDVFKIMKKFDNFINNIKVISLSDATQTLNKLKSIGGKNER